MQGRRWTAAASVMPAGTHHSKMGCRHAADHALRRQFAQPVDRIDDIHGALEPGAVEIDRGLADQDITRWYVGWQDAALRPAVAAAGGILVVLAILGHHPVNALLQRRSDEPTPLLARGGPGCKRGSA